MTEISEADSTRKFTDDIQTTGHLFKTNRLDAQTIKNTMCPACLSDYQKTIIISNTMNACIGQNFTQF